jgi:hypothetical protein
VTVMVTRREFLARSLSKQQPWLAGGVSRRTWERRRRKNAEATSASGASPPVPSATAKSVRPPLPRDLDVRIPSTNAPRAALNLSNDKTPTPPHKKFQVRHDEDLVMRGIHAFWDAQGMTPSEPQALLKAIKAIILPERFKQMHKRALVKVYRRARERLPEGYDEWVSWIEKWDKSYSRQKARDLIDRLIAALGDRPRGILNEVFDRLENRLDYRQKRSWSSNVCVCDWKRRSTTYRSTALEKKTSLALGSMPSWPMGQKPNSSFPKGLSEVRTRSDQLVSNSETQV